MTYHIKAHKGADLIEEVYDRLSECLHAPNVNRQIKCHDVNNINLTSKTNTLQENKRGRDELEKLNAGNHRRYQDTEKEKNIPVIFGSCVF